MGSIATAHPLVRWVALCVLILLTKLKFLHFLFPEALMDKLLIGWDHEMMWVAMTNFGKKLFLDQPCVLPDPASFKPVVESKHGFSEEEIKRFYTQGFFGPITIFSEDEMAVMRKDIEEVLLSEKRKSKVYRVGEGMNEVKGTDLVDRNYILEGFNGRDRHIDCFEIWNLINQDIIKDKLASLLGPDLLIWRSQFFNKMPGAPAVVWHAASTYLSEMLSEPVLRPKNINSLFQVTTWVAIDNADLENGCMHFIPGTHRRFLAAVDTNASKDDPNGKFAGISFRPDCDFTDPFPLPEASYKSGKVVAMPLRAGQCVMFFERTVHASPPNGTKDRRRMGITFRTVRSDCKIYGSRKWHGVTYLGAKFDLDNWGALALRGNSGTINRIIAPPQKK